MTTPQPPGAGLHLSRDPLCPAHEAQWPEGGEETAPASIGIPGRMSQHLTVDKCEDRGQWAGVWVCKRERARGVGAHVQAQEIQLQGVCVCERDKAFGAGLMAVSQASSQTWGSGNKVHVGKENWEEGVVGKNRPSDVSQAPHTHCVQT